MKIDQPGLPYGVPETGLNGVGANGSSAQRSGLAPGAGSLPLDQANISSLGATASLLQAQLEQVPEVRQERVDSLRSEVDSGTYTVDAEKVADSMLADLTPAGQS